MDLMISNHPESLFCLPDRASLATQYVNDALGKLGLFASPNRTRFLYSST
jgi:hypothetical protein